MSMEAVQAMAKHSKAKDSARLVAVALAFYAQRDTGLSWPSDRELRAFTGLSKSTLHEALRSLERAGEIHRRPRESGDPRRTYRVNPRGGHQLALPIDEGTPVRTLAGEDKGPNSASEGPAHAGAGKNRLNRRKNTPPTPRKRGGRAPNLMGRLSAAPEPCPGFEAVELWASLAERLPERVGEAETEIWFAGAHLHEASERLVLALPPTTVSWVRRRFGNVVATVAECPVEFVACLGGVER